MRQLQKALLTLPELPLYGSKDQAIAFLLITESYKILNKIGYIYSDNHGLNNKICYFISIGL